MDKTIANYRIIIEKEKYDSGEVVYTASVPTLKIHDYAPTVEELLESVKEAVELAVGCLAEEKAEIPADSGEQIIANTFVKIPQGAHLAFA